MLTACMHRVYTRARGIKAIAVMISMSKYGYIALALYIHTYVRIYNVKCKPAAEVAHKLHTVVDF